MTDTPINNKEPRFLTLEEVKSLYESLIDAHGGSYGIRDQGLLESAIAAPKQVFGGQYAYTFPHEMAAVYLYHLCKNHAFVDGNKRIAFVAAVFFMRLNGWNFVADEQDAIQAVLRVASGEMEKPEIAAWIKGLSRPRPSIELRDFLQNLTREHVYYYSQAFVAGGTDAEKLASLAEATRAIPVVGKILEFMREADPDDDKERTAEHASYLGLLLAIYRIAEDMGYEW